MQPEGSRRTRWAAVAVAIAAGIVAAFHVGKLPSSLPALRAEYALSLVAAGWVASAFNTVGTFGAMAIGVASTRVPRLAIVLGGLVLLACAGALGAAASGEALLLASRALEGTGFLAVVVAAPALIVAASATGERGLALGLWSTYMPVGVTLALALTPSALATIGWRGLWIAIAASAAAVALALALQRRHYAEDAVPDATPDGVHWRGAGRTLSQGALWLLGLAFALYTAQWMTLMTWMPTYLIDEWGVTPARAALATAFAVAWNIPGNLLGTWAARRGVRFGTLIATASALMGIAEPVIFAETFPPTVRGIAFVVFSCAGGMLPAAILSAAPRLARRADHVALTNGIAVQGSNVGQFVGPPVVAAIVAAAHDWSAAVPFLVACAVCALACGVLLDRLGALPAQR